MPTVDAFVARAQELTEGTPYTVTPTASGCEIGIDVNDARWFGVLSEHGLRRTFSHRVELDESAGVMKVSDRSRSLSWDSGADGQLRPRLEGEVSTTRGRVTEKSFGHEYGWDRDGGFGEQVDYTFDSGEGRALIKKVADEQGWKEGLGRDQKIGLYVAVGVVALIVVVGLVTAAVLLLG